MAERFRIDEIDGQYPVYDTGSDAHISAFFDDKNDAEQFLAYMQRYYANRNIIGIGLGWFPFTGAEPKLTIIPICDDD